MSKYLKYGLSLVAVVFSLNITTTVLANGFYAPPKMLYFDGPYMGLDVGIVHTHMNVRHELNVYYPREEREPWLFRYSENFNSGKHGVDAGMFFGYGRMLNSSYYLGGELFGHYLNPEFGFSNSARVIISSNYGLINSGVIIKNPFSLGGDIRAGYLVSPKVMAYILFGLDCSKFKVDSESSTIYTPTEGTDVSISDSFTKCKLGYFPGVGIETGLTDHVSLRAEYIYTFYSSFSNTVSDSKTSEKGIINSFLATKVKPNKSLFTVKLSYLFN